MSSPYQPKSPMPIGTSLATAKKLFQGGGGGDNLHNETADSNSTLSTLPSQARSAPFLYISFEIIPENEFPDARLNVVSRDTFVNFRNIGIHTKLIYIHTHILHTTSAC